MTLLHSEAKTDGAFFRTPWHSTDSAAWSKVEDPELAEWVEDPELAERVEDPEPVSRFAGDDGRSRRP